MPTVQCLAKLAICGKNPHFKYVSVVSTLQFPICFGTNGNKMRAACCIYFVKKCHRHIRALTAKHKHLLTSGYDTRPIVCYVEKFVPYGELAEAINWIKKTFICLDALGLGYTFLPVIGWHLTSSKLFVLPQYHTLTHIWNTKTKKWLYSVCTTDNVESFLMKALSAAPFPSYKNMRHKTHNGKFKMSVSTATFHVLHFEFILVISRRKL